LGAVQARQNRPIRAPPHVKGGFLGITKSNTLQFFIVKLDSKQWPNYYQKYASTLGFDDNTGYTQYGLKIILKKFLQKYVIALLVNFYGG
jgi:hypothetical protein